MSKICSQCKQQKDVSDFGTNKSKKDGLQCICKVCRNQYLKEWYSKNKDVQAKRVRKNDAERRHELHLAMYGWLGDKQCIDCGEKDVIVLDCDHVRDKAFSISVMINRKMSWSAILLELEKCEVRCANCHRKKTARENGSYRFVFAGKLPQKH